MLALLGPPPEALLADSGPHALEILVLASSLEHAKKTMTVEESAAFLSFVRRTLTWTAENEPLLQNCSMIPGLQILIILV